MYSPIITSKMADQHFQKIKVEHSNILQGMQNQSVKIAEMNKQKAIEAEQTRQMNAEREASMKKDQMAFDKEKMTADLKTKELEIKRAALLR